MTNEHSRRAHWQNVYATKSEDAVSWFEESPAVSLELVRATGASATTSIIDIGGGASRLVDALVRDGFESVTVLDLSEKALELARARLGAASKKARWIVADVTTWQPQETYDVWHDRAAFHFLTQPSERAAYARCVASAVRSGGHVIIGTFALDGPERCSGLDVVRHDEASISKVLGRSFDLVEARRVDHKTPSGAIQHFQFSRYRRSD